VFGRHSCTDRNCSRAAAAKIISPADRIIYPRRRGRIVRGRAESGLRQMRQLRCAAPQIGLSGGVKGGMAGDEPVNRKIDACIRLGGRACVRAQQMRTFGLTRCSSPYSQKNTHTNSRIRRQAG